MLILLTLFNEVMDLTFAFIGGGAVGTIVPLFDGIVALIELIGYGGYEAQHNDHPYANQCKTHNLPLISYL